MRILQKTAEDILVFRKRKSRMHNFCTLPFLRSILFSFPGNEKEKDGIVPVLSELLFVLVALAAEHKAIVQIVLVSPRFLRMVSFLLDPYVPVVAECGNHPHYERDEEEKQCEQLAVSELPADASIGAYRLYCSDKCCNDRPREALRSSSPSALSTH